MDILELVDSMTGHEVAAAEDAAGLSIASLADDLAPKTKLIAAMVWQLRRRAEPQLKLSDVLAQPSAQIMTDLGKFEEVEPEPAEQFPVDDDTAGAGRGAGDVEGPLLSGDGAPAE